MVFYPLFLFCLASAAMAQPSIGLEAACNTLDALLSVSAEMAQPQYGVKSLCESQNADVTTFFRDDHDNARECYLNMMDEYQLKIQKARQEVENNGCGKAYWEAPATCSQVCMVDMAEAVAAFLLPSPTCASMANLMTCNLEQMCDLLTTTTTTTTTITNTRSNTSTLQVCNRDTGGMCTIFPCHPERGPTECSHTTAFMKQCLCLDGYCATKNGTCVKYELFHTCAKDTHATCQWGSQNCLPYQAECKNGKCMCGQNDCAGKFGICESGLDLLPPPPPSPNDDKCPAQSTQAQKSSVSSVLANCLDFLPDVGGPVFTCVVFSMFLMLVVAAWTWRTIGQSTRATYSEPLLHAPA